MVITNERCDLFDCRSQRKPTDLFKAIDTSNMIKSGKYICDGVSEVLWTLRYENLAVIIMDDSID
ncbi:hypothetical protein HK098_008178, partial [Nowakowskiella sp. JEL0407]